MALWSCGLVALWPRSAPVLASARPRASLGKVCGDYWSFSPKISISQFHAGPASAISRGSRIHHFLQEPHSRFPAVAACATSLRSRGRDFPQEPHAQSPEIANAAPMALARNCVCGSCGSCGSQNPDSRVWDCSISFARHPCPLMSLDPKPCGCVYHH